MSRPARERTGLRQRGLPTSTPSPEREVGNKPTPIGIKSPVTITRLIALFACFALAACDASPPAESLEDPKRTKTAGRESGVVLVYFQKEKGDTYSRDGYRARPRRVSPEQSTVGHLTTAVNELVQGPTKAEQQSGLASVFSRQTSGILRNVRLDDRGKAVVNFKPFADEIPSPSAADASAHLIFSLNETVFQFSAVDAIDYRVNGDCDAFWEPLASQCQTFSRTKWLATRVTSQ